MDDVAEELVVGPRHLSRRTRLVAGRLLVIVLVLSVLPGGARQPACQPSDESPGVRPWLGADDPVVQRLHYAALDRRRTPDDAAPADVLPADVGRSARKLGETGGVVVYLAGGSGFVCLGVDGRQAHFSTASVCMLTTTIANQGLVATLESDDNQEALLVVAVPDGAELHVRPTTERLADHTNAVVVRLGRAQMLLQEPDQPPIVVGQVYAEDTSFASCWGSGHR